MAPRYGDMTLVSPYDAGSPPSDSNGTPHKRRPDRRTAHWADGTLNVWLGTYGLAQRSTPRSGGTPLFGVRLTLRAPGRKPRAVDRLPLRRADGEIVGSVRSTVEQWRVAGRCTTVPDRQTRGQRKLGWNIMSGNSLRGRPGGPPITLATSLETENFTCCKAQHLASPESNP
jgi:hypothetical protein